MAFTTKLISDQPTQERSTPAPDVRFLLLPLPEFSMLPFGGFVDKLRFSADEADDSQQRHCSWRVLGLKPGVITSSSGIAINVQVTTEEIQLSGYDYIVVFGSRTARRNLDVAESYSGFLLKAAAQDLTVVSIDNACFLLAACGLLTGRKVALHWRHELEFRTAFPKIEIRNEQLYCFDGKRVTCGGGSAAIDLAVELLARHCGRTRALKGLADMLVDEARGQQHHLKSLDEEASQERHIGRSISLMRNLLAEKKTTGEIAALIGISRRQLDRLFKNRFGQTAHSYWAEMRLQHVRWRLINSAHSLAILADEIGIQDTSYLCKIVRKRFGHSPETLRKQRP
ncbi:MAG: helix-turn-helix domain-containing protein [Motiliproteus sp.]